MGDIIKNKNGNLSYNKDEIVKLLEEGYIIYVVVESTDLHDQYDGTQKMTTVFHVGRIDDLDEYKKFSYWEIDDTFDDLEDAIKEARGRANKVNENKGIYIGEQREACKKVAGDISKFKEEFIARVYNSMIDYSWEASYGEGYAIEDALEWSGFKVIDEVISMVDTIEWYQLYQVIYDTLYKNKEFEVIENYKETFKYWDVIEKDVTIAKRSEYENKVRTGSVKKISEILSVDKPYRKNSWLTYQKPERVRKSNVNIEVMAFLNDFLTNYDINAKYDIKFNQLRNASIEDGFIENGDIDVDITFKTYSGVRVRASLIVSIRDNKLVEPSTLSIEGNMKIISQTAFDDIIKSKSFTRNMFKSPEDFVSTDLVKTYLNTQIPYIDFGVYDGNE